MHADDISLGSLGIYLGPHSYNFGFRNSTFPVKLSASTPVARIILPIEATSRKTNGYNGADTGVCRVNILF